MNNVLGKCVYVDDNTGESRKIPTAEGATAPETLRQKGPYWLLRHSGKRTELCATEGVKLSGIRDRGGGKRHSPLFKPCAEYDDERRNTSKIAIGCLAPR